MQDIKQQEERNWERRFERFWQKNILDKGIQIKGTTPINPQEHPHKLIKSFTQSEISLAVEQEKEKVLAMVLKEIEGIKQKEHHHEDCESYLDCQMFARHTRSHNQALDTLKKKLQAKQ